jgi:hypothetical protein
VADTAVGAPGTVDGVAAADAADAALVPTEFVAVTLNVYAVPLVSPVTVQRRVVSFVLHLKLPGVDVTVEFVTAVPPFDVSVQVTVDWPFSLLVAATPLGASGAVLAIACTGASSSDAAYTCGIARAVGIDSACTTAGAIGRPAAVSLVERPSTVTWLMTAAVVAVVSSLTARWNTIAADAAGFASVPAANGAVAVQTTVVVFSKPSVTTHAGSSEVATSDAGIFNVVTGAPVVAAPALRTVSVATLTGPPATRAGDTVKPDEIGSAGGAVEPVTDAIVNDKIP